MEKRGKILFLDLKKDEKELFNNSFKDFDISFSKIKDTDVISTFVSTEITKDVLDKMPSLKLIVTRSTGYDHIDLNECKKRKITVCNVPKYGENTVAEHAFTLLLSLSKKIINSAGKYGQRYFNLDELRGFDLKDKTIGIIGGGNIGQHMARMAKGFDMNVILYDINKNKKLAKDIGFKYVPLDKLIKESDIISLHIPHNNHTHHIINKDNINMMKKGVVIINTSRGEIIDTNALIYGLKKGIVGGAGLDVLEHDNKLNDKLSKMKNVLITPHNAFNTKEAIERINNTTIQNILKYYSKRPINKVI